MASGQDLSGFDAALKNHYTNDRVEDMVYKDNPFMALVPKYESFGGRNLPIPIIYGNPTGRSKTFSTAKTSGGTSGSGSKITDFVLTRTKDYGIATIDNETMWASEGDPNAFVEAATTEMLPTGNKASLPEMIETEAIPVVASCKVPLPTLVKELTEPVASAALSVGATPVAISINALGNSLSNIEPSKVLAPSSVSQASKFEPPNNSMIS